MSPELEIYLAAHWLNDGVKGYPSDRADFVPLLQLGHLRVLVAQPEYLWAMKCLEWRIGADFHDAEDVRYLLRLLSGFAREGQALP